MSRSSATRRSAQRQRRHRIGAGGTTNAEVDASGVRGLQQRELLGNGQRRMVGQHHPARTQPQLRRLRGQMRDQHRRAGGRHGGHVVVLRQPVARVAEPIGRLSEVRRRRQRIGRRLVGAHRNEV